MGLELGLAGDKNPCFDLGYDSQPHWKIAQELRDLVNELRKRSGGQPGLAAVVPLAQSRGELSDLLQVSYPGRSQAELQIGLF